MKIIKLYSNIDHKSYFLEIEIDVESIQPLGQYSKRFSCKGLQFRNFEQGALYDWHNAPQPQYIIYLEGMVEVEASGGETRLFNPGDILFATDTTGKGHITRTLSKGKSIIITTQ